MPQLNRKVLVALKSVFLSIVFFLAAHTYSYAANVCGIKAILHISSTGACGQADINNPPVVQSGCTATLESDNCVAENWNICCPDTVTSYQDTTKSYVTITNVPQGSEETTAQQYAADMINTQNLPVAASGYSLTGSMSGYAYTVSNGQQQGTNDVHIEVWVRGVYSKDGSNPSDIVPIDNIGSNTMQDIKNAVKDGVSEGMQGAWGTIDEVPGWSTITLSLDSSVPAVQQNSLSDNVVSFISSNPMTQLLGGSGVQFGSGGTCAWYYSYGGKEIEFSLDRHSGKFAVLGQIVFGVSIVFAIFILLKGG